MATLNLSDIGTSADLFKTGPSSPLAKFLMDWAEEQVYRLRAEAPKATGGLGQSIAPNLDTEEKVAGRWSFM